MPAKYRPEAVLLTYDTGQATRGRRVGLNVRKLDRPLEDGEHQLRRNPTGRPSASTFGSDHRMQNAPTQPPELERFAGVVRAKDAKFRAEKGQLIG
jgi:hypothetical protein